MIQARLTRKINLVSAIVILSGYLETVAAQGNLVFNGSFNVDANGWTQTDIGPQAGWNGKGHPFGCFVLDATPSPSLSPMISQIINGLIPGDTYSVSGDYAYTEPQTVINPTADPNFGVSIDGTYVFETAIPAISPWLTFDVTFTASTSQVNLSLASQLNNTIPGAIVDNISLQQIPEPGELLWLVGAVGIAGGLFMGRRSVHDSHLSGFLDAHERS